MTVNNVVLSGRTSYVREFNTKNGKGCSFQLGVWLGKDKDNKNQYLNISVTVFDSQMAEGIIANGDGTNVIVCGRLNQNVYTNKDGKEIKTPIVFADTVATEV